MKRLVGLLAAIAFVISVGACKKEAAAPGKTPTPKGTPAAVKTPVPVVKTPVTIPGAPGTTVPKVIAPPTTATLPKK